ncbi:hypothetical protein [Mycoplasma procyoni]|uniref:hypothetical protein n=1 Tax=Mycoplasma procyoni TaxID=568784 RepID=UPI00197BC49A|nr:hypothetical protein [Mycoplasma procyoni]MBN3534444.1 hypothetical protein [Mycoplasma procyoni]
MKKSKKIISLSLVSACVLSSPFLTLACKQKEQEQKKYYKNERLYYQNKSFYDSDKNDVELDKTTTFNSLLVWEDMDKPKVISSTDELKEIIEYTDKSKKTYEKLWNEETLIYLKREPVPLDKTKLEENKKRWEEEKKRLIKKFDNSYFKDKKILLINRGVSTSQYYDFLERWFFDTKPALKQFYEGNNKAYSRFFIRTYTFDKKKIISFNKLYDYALHKSKNPAKLNDNYFFGKVTALDKPGENYIFRINNTNSFAVELDKNFEIDEKANYSFNILYGFKWNVENSDYEWGLNDYNYFSNAIDFYSKQEFTKLKYYYEGYYPSKLTKEDLWLLSPRSVQIFADPDRSVVPPEWDKK